MADFEKVSLSDDELDALSNNDFAEIARKGRIDGEISVEELQMVTSETLVRFKEYLAKNSENTGITKSTLDGLKGIVAKVGTLPIPTSPEAPKSDAVIPPTAGDKENSIEQKDLPLAPTTAFNVMRLVQLGYFPKDYAPLWWEKPGTFHKWVQMFYVLPGKLGEWARTNANIAFQKKFDRDPVYKDFMLDLTKHMNAELEDWFKQNKLSQKSNIDSAKQSLVEMRAAFDAGNTKAGMDHFNTLTEKMGLRVNGKWHEPGADLEWLKDKQDLKTTTAEQKLQARKDIQIKRDSQLKARKDDLKAENVKIDELYAKESGYGIEDKFKANDIKKTDIDAEIRKLQLEKTTLKNHTGALTSAPQDIKDAISGRDFAAIKQARNNIGFEHLTQADTFLPTGSQLDLEQNKIISKTAEIKSYEKSGGSISLAEMDVKKYTAIIDTKEKRLSQIEWLLVQTTIDHAAKASLESEKRLILGEPTATPPVLSSLEEAKIKLSQSEQTLETKRSELETKRSEFEVLEKNKRNLLSQSKQNKIAFEWFNTRMNNIAQIWEKIRVYTDLNPLVEARNVSARKLSLTEKSIAKSAESITKREQKVTDVHAKVSPIHDALYKLNDPSISPSEKLAMNEKLNELLAQKNSEAERIQGLLKGTPTERNTAMRELQNILDNQGKWVEFFKTSLESIEWKITWYRTEASRIMTEFDRQAWTGDVEALRKKMEIEIGKINTEIERLNADASVHYRTATVLLAPLQLESLHQQTKLGAFFGAMNKWTTKLESLGSTKVGWKAMRWVYGAMMLAGIGQIGVTSAQSGMKQGAIDAADLGIGFIPVVGGAYDIVVGWAQFFKWSEITSDREITKTDALKRVGFGVLGLIPIAWQMFKAAAKWEKIIEVARKVAVVERTAQVTGKVLILNEAKNLWVALYDASGSVVSENGWVMKTAEVVLTGKRFPINVPVN